MGFRPAAVQYKLKFTDAGLDGLEVTMGSLTVREFNAMLRMAVVQGISDEALDANDKTLEQFATHLISWNLEDTTTGEPVPATLEGVHGQEKRLIGKMITAWQLALVGISDPLAAASPNGATSEEASLGLATESLSPGS